MRPGLEAIFAPKSIAVVGASDKPGSVGGAIFSNLISAEYRGGLFAVNSNSSVVQGRLAYRFLRALPEIPDLVVVCTPASTVPQLIRECGQLGIPGLIVISAGFQEAGGVGRERNRELITASHEFPSVRFIGPNCPGVLRPANRLNSSFSPVMPRQGNVTFLSQSGALCTAILDWAVERGIGFASCVSVGNMTNVGMEDLLDYFAEDEQTQVVLLYLEGIDNASALLSAARRFSRRKPLIVCKSGRFAASAMAAASHTGAIASPDAICNIAFNHSGMKRVDSIEELFECASLITGTHRLQGDRLAIVTNAGGPGVMATDAWLTLGHQLAHLSADTIGALNEKLPSSWSHRNPVDILGDADVARFQGAIHHVISDPNVDELLVVVPPQKMTDSKAIAETVVSVKKRFDKPIIASFMGGPAMLAAREVLKDGGIPHYDFPEAAIRALSPVVGLCEVQRGIEKPLPSSEASTNDPSTLSEPIVQDRAARWRSELGTRRGLLDELKSKELLPDYGIPVVQGRIATSADNAVQLAEQIGFPVVLKIISPDISHKTDVGGIALNVPDGKSVREIFTTMTKAISSSKPEAKIDGICVQPMVSSARGVELLLGMTRDPQFGPVVMLGAGEVTAELQHDSAMELQPFDQNASDRMLRSLRLYPLLEGYRGRPGVNLAQLRTVLASFFQLIDDLPELSMIEINPQLATGERCIALDARMAVRYADKKQTLMVRMKTPSIKPTGIEKRRTESSITPQSVSQQRDSI